MTLPWFVASDLSRGVCERRKYIEFMKKFHSKLHAQVIAKFHFTGSTRGFPSRVFDSYLILHLISVVSVNNIVTNIVFYHFYFISNVL